MHVYCMYTYISISTTQYMVAVLSNIFPVNLSCGCSRFCRETFAGPQWTFTGCFAPTELLQKLISVSPKMVYGLSGSGGRGRKVRRGVGHLRAAVDRRSQEFACTELILVQELASRKFPLLGLQAETWKMDEMGSRVAFSNFHRHIFKHGYVHYRLLHRH